MASALDLDDQRRLNMTLNYRETIIKELMKNNKPPEDTGGRILLVAALDGLDRTVLSRAKLSVDQDSAKSQQQMAAMMATVLNNINTPPSAPRVAAPVLDTSFVVENPVPGETDIGTQTLNLKEFNALS